MAKLANKHALWFNDSDTGITLMLLVQQLA